MTHLAPPELLTALRQRFTTKRYDPQRKLSPELWATLEETLRLSPSSYGLQPWKFIVVQDPALRARLRERSWNQSPVVEASHFVVLTRLVTISPAYVARYFRLVESERGLPVGQLAAFEAVVAKQWANDSDPPRVAAWTARQAYIAMGSFLTAAALLGVDATPMEGFEPLAYDELLGLTSGPYRSVAAIAAGYGHPDDPARKEAKVRFPKEEVFEYR